MPRRPSLSPAIPHKVYLSQENAASMMLLTHKDGSDRAIHGEVSRIINLALTEFFSPDRKEYLEWKAQKQQPGSQPSEPRPSEARS